MGLKVEDRLDGNLNFTTWKVRIKLALEEEDLLQFIEVKELTKPTDIDELKKFKRDTIEAMKILIDSVKDHLVTSIASFTTARDMFSHLQGTYEVNNLSREITLRQQLLNIKMAKEDFVISYFMRILELKNQLGLIGHNMEEKDLVMITLNGLPHSWKSFIQTISGRTELPTLDHLKNYCIQEESHLITRGQTKSPHVDDHHMLAAQCKKGGNWKKPYPKRNREFKPFSSQHPWKKPRDTSHVRCFRCDKFSHYAKECQNNPNQSEANLNEVSKQNDDFLFIFALSSSVPLDSNTWLIDSGASRQITGYCDHLSDLVEKDTSLHVVIGDDAHYSVRGSGSTSLNLDSSISLHLSDILFVPRIKRNLISISTLEDKGYQIAFSEGRVLALPKKASFKYARIIGHR